MILTLLNGYKWINGIFFFPFFFFFFCSFIFSWLNVDYILNDPNTPQILKFTKISLKLLKDLPYNSPNTQSIEYPIKPIY
jgi:hypothetical protein